MHNLLLNKQIQQTSYIAISSKKVNEKKYENFSWTLLFSYLTFLSRSCIHKKPSSYYLIVKIEDIRKNHLKIISSIENVNILCLKEIHFRNQEKKKKYISTIEQSEAILLTLLFWIQGYWISLWFMYILNAFFLQCVYRYICL